jgi:hypothetical protein
MREVLRTIRKPCHIRFGKASVFAAEPSMPPVCETTLILPSIQGETPNAIEEWKNENPIFLHLVMTRIQQCDGSDVQINL